jgi:hypothetical protein
MFWPSRVNIKGTFLCSFYFLLLTTLYLRPAKDCGSGSSVGMAIGYGLDSPGIKSRWGRDFSHLSRPVLGSTQPPVQWVPVLSRGKERPRRDADPSPLLVPWSIKSRTIPLLPLRTIRPVQSLSTCTRVQFTFTFYYQKLLGCPPTGQYFSWFLYV